ncbi:MAG: SDR family oxidoreductase [Steroidobacteraceae bacterium]
MLGHRSPRSSRRYHKPGEMYRRWIDGTPMARLGEPEEVASLSSFSHPNASRLMTGSIVVADGGYTCW